MVPKVLVVLTSHDEIPGHGKTGWYLVSFLSDKPQTTVIGVKHKLTHHSTSKPEFAHPHEVLHDKVSLTIASPKGGEAPLDQNSVKMFESDPVSQTFLKEQKALWTNTHKLADIVPRAGEFDAIFYVGGHGRMCLLLDPILSSFLRGTSFFINGFSGKEAMSKVKAKRIANDIQPCSI